jgi:hypothetical protein
MDYAAKTSSDGFTAQTRLSTESSNPFVQFADGSFIGDYSQVPSTQLRPRPMEPGRTSAASQV